MSIDPSTNKTLILIHGEGRKPAPATLQSLWMQAVANGLARDHRKSVPLLSSVPTQLIYYDDVLRGTRPPAVTSADEYDEVLDVADRQAAVASLLILDKARKFRRVNYESIPGKSSTREFIADIAAPVAGKLGLGQQYWQKVSPDLVTYLTQPDTARAIEARLAPVLKSALEQGCEVMLIAHSLGAVIAYNVLWDMCHAPSHSHADGEPEGKPPGEKLHTWLTTGAPLADNWLRHHLRGADYPVDRRFPNNLINWQNFAAEDDHHCHDETMANDFAAMRTLHQLSKLEDTRIYNLAVRYGRSDPHSALGYLTHPRTSDLLAGWLTGKNPSVIPPAEVEEEN